MNKIFGYTLLLIGIGLIIYPVINVYKTFNGQITPYALFTNKGISIDLSKFVDGAPKNVNLTQELISPELLNKPMNLAAHIVLMGFIASVGFKIASIGTMLVRTIKVTVNEDKSFVAGQKPSWK